MILSMDSFQPDKHIKIVLFSQNLGKKQSFSLLSKNSNNPGEKLDIKFIKTMRFDVWLILVVTYKSIPGNFPGLRKGTNLAPIANAIEGPNINPLASTPRM